MSVAHPPAAHAEAHAAEHDHPGPRTYVIVGVVLAIITALEIALYYVPSSNPITAFNTPILLVMSAAKFVTVVGFFMHLKFDAPIFRYMFGFGLMIAASIITALLFLFSIYPLPHVVVTGTPH
jgi:caa(3)-type oxidase subunit IV